MADSKPESVPVLPWMRDPVHIDEVDTCPLHLLPGLDRRLEAALKLMGIQSLFRVQVAVWQEIMGFGAFERDICVNSPTGSGKTLAYALPIVQLLSTRKIKCLRALVVVPTRDLALQVKEVFTAIAPAVGLHVGLAIGQSSIADEILQLIKRPKLGMTSPFDPEDLPMELESAVDILVATPGRLMDHINTTKGFSLKHLCYLVVDETDRLLRESYQSWLQTVLEIRHSNDEALSTRAITSPSMLCSLNTRRICGIDRGFKDKPYPRLAKIILSATLTRDPSKLSQFNLHHPLLLKSGHKRYQLPENLKSHILICKTSMKALYLVSLLEALRGEKCIIFTSSVESTNRLNTLLKQFGDLPFKFSEFSSRQPQWSRKKTLKAFREGKVDVLVATDAFARGMDVIGVRNVINYDMPSYTKTYVHRAGRTARADQTGCCFTLMSKSQVKSFENMLQKADNNSYSTYSLPAESLERRHSSYLSALEKLKKHVEFRSKKKMQS
ncbi:uncharacterized protein A4U43_C04F5420 [Asparagus officinalis]|uniref:ATP-dependent RNA helicase n=1 Tax=Asparagus officinalis TaxID=4686 RepID=A0A5P1F3F3_ASPOF|nr:DEAD-box ATP-dependent RNA helicase 1 [Asparagus officinalis]ONK71161.1 uncharacterized protein A4U43_C04F5420 [Asparagus officinalis]